MFEEYKLLTSIMEIPTWGVEYRGESSNDRQEMIIVNEGLSKCLVHSVYVPYSLHKHSWNQFEEKNTLSCSRVTIDIKSNKTDEYVISWNLIVMSRVGGGHILFQ